MATAEFSKFAGTLSVALSQHHLLGFEIAQLESYCLREVQSIMEKRDMNKIIPAVVMHGLSCPGMWDLPRPQMEPVSPALAGKFFTTEPPGKSRRGSVFRELCLESTLPRVRVFPHLQLGKGTSLGLRGNLTLCPLQLRTQESGV